jgi:hypothetical protein
MDFPLHPPIVFFTNLAAPRQSRNQKKKIFHHETHEGHEGVGYFFQNFVLFGLRGTSPIHAAAA